MVPEGSREDTCSSMCAYSLSMEAINLQRKELDSLKYLQCKQIVVQAFDVSFL